MRGGLINRARRCYERKRGHTRSFVCWLRLLIAINLAIATAAAHAQIKVPGTSQAAKAPPIVINVPKQPAPIVNMPPAPESPVWPSYAGLVIALLGTAATVYAAVAAMRAAKATEQTVNEMQRVTEEQSRPYVVISLEFDRQEHWFDLVMRNVGKTPALNVTAIGSPLDPIVTQYKTEASGWPTSIPSMAPGQEMQRMLGPSGLFYYGEKGWHPDISVNLHYESQSGQTYDERHTFSFAAFEGTRFDNQQADVVRAIKDIANNTSVFKMNSTRDPLFWRIWKSLADSQLEAAVIRTEEGYVAKFRKQESGTSDGSKGVPAPNSEIFQNYAFSEPILGEEVTEDKA